jgi:hypothetical protein
MVIYLPSQYADTIYRLIASITINILDEGIATITRTSGPDA